MTEATRVSLLYQCESSQELEADGKKQGMLHKTRPIFSTQFHPEAKGGPMDSSFLFDRYLQSVKMFKDSQKVYKDNRPSGLLVELLSKERVGV